MFVCDFIYNKYNNKSSDTIFITDASSSNEAVHLQQRLRSLSTELVTLRNRLHVQGTQAPPLKSPPAAVVAAAVAAAAPPAAAAAAPIAPIPPAAPIVQPAIPPRQVLNVPVPLVSHLLISYANAIFHSVQLV